MSNKKRIVIISLIILSVISTIVVSCAIFDFHHPTHYLYNDEFILGNTYDKIVERYGSFDLNGIPQHENGYGYLVEPSITGFWGTSLPVYYVVDFENSIAVSVCLELGGWGG